MHGGRWSASERLLLLITIASVAAMVAMAWVRLRPRPAPRMEIPGVAGIHLDSLSLLTDGGRHSLSLRTGRPRLIYLFATTCEYCSAEQARVKAMLTPLDTSEYLTGSLEPTQVTAGYWGRGPVPPPVSIAVAMVFSPKLVHLVTRFGSGLELG